MLYLDDVRQCLHALKYGGRRRIASVLGRRAGRAWVAEGELGGASAVVPVPLSRGRRRKRGYNQAELIARAVAREAGIPLRARVLKKTKECPPQTGLSAAARRTNVASAYRARLPRSLRGKGLLLVDDVLTTGATAEAASLALLAAGAGAVDVLTLARVPAFAQSAAAGKPVHSTEALEYGASIGGGGA
jgi:ComF family protein